MMRKTLIVTVSVAVLALSACSGGRFGEHGGKESVGTLLGAGIGALAGAQVGGGSGRVAAAAVGTLLGAYLGNQTGKSLDRADRQYAALAQSEALERAPSGQPTVWRNPDSGNYGDITPTQTYRTSEGQYCREYRHTVNVGGREEQAYGTACRQPDGSWRVSD